MKAKTVWEIWSDENLVNQDYYINDLSGNVWFFIHADVRWANVFGLRIGNVRLGGKGGGKIIGDSDE